MTIKGIRPGTVRASQKPNNLFDIHIRVTCYPNKPIIPETQ
ncbi:hypothetical protein DCCM_0823 [Desulfocucumis palustris]|uniref:Uncharacterized protein n=1 Tax=Desulfocucumis palustris TaxID=1898651 RepID=A0A2L2X8S3_9FIRM|nr:hypothetical protein DCCM_0823 [Desulfocucumis palustris]